MLTLPEFVELCQTSTGGAVFVFALWSLAVLAIMVYGFSKGPGGWLRGWLQRRARGRDVPILRAEVRAESQAIKAAREAKPSEPELEALRMRTETLQKQMQYIDDVTRAPCYERWLGTLLGCPACQCFWSGVLLMATTHALPAGADVWPRIVGVLPHALVALVLYNWLLAPPRPDTMPQPSGGGCKGCGNKAGNGAPSAPSTQPVPNPVQSTTPTGVKE